MDAPEKRWLYCTDPAEVRDALVSHLRIHNLLRGVTRLGLAVSGGADSVALFDLMLPVCREAGIAVTVIHLNHGLRTDADGDAQFVRGLCERARVDFLYEKVSVPDLMRSGLSLEMAAREARMAFFARCCESARLDALATGHQADDVAESLLLRLARGAGAAGLSGLRPISTLSPPASPVATPTRLTLIRPLLTLSASAVRAWLRQNDRVWREDASNSDCAIPRNRVRNEVLPHLEATWAPDLRARLCQSAETLREDDALLDAMATGQLDVTAVGNALPVDRLCQQATALQRRILRQWLFLKKLPEATGLETTLALLAQCRRTGNWKQQLPGGALAVCNSGLLSIARVGSAPPEAADVEDNTCLMWGNVTILSEPSHGVFSMADGIGSYPAVCTLDADRLKGKRLCVRARQPGDRITPTGLAGSKKIQDLFVDSKIPEQQRDFLPIFVCGNEVVWIPGYRISRHYAVTSPDAPSVRVTVRQQTHPA